MNLSVMRELETIRSQSDDGKLHPENVVAYASDPNTELHSRFTWDDTDAAQKYRLWEARQLIAVAVQVIAEGAPAYRAYVSLRSDRMAGGGYQSLNVVLRSPKMYGELLEDALEEIERLQEKYGRLKELRPIWQAAKQVRTRRNPQAA